jgi:hypothetical protein
VPEAMKPRTIRIEGAPSQATIDSKAA